MSVKRLADFAMRISAAIYIFSSIVFGQGLPETMTRISVRLESPDVSDQSFAAQPKLMYRAGTRYCRTEERPDPEHGIHGLMMNEPDAWNGKSALQRRLSTLSIPARRSICHLPIFRGEQVKSAAGVKDPLLELEFGQELVFFKGRALLRERGRFLGRSQPVLTLLRSVVRSYPFSRREHRSGPGLLPGTLECEGDLLVRRLRATPV